ncbi:hypothetical protein HF650_10020 [Kosakonia sp. SMBL-WEM22]|uniref:hypothetical protein n=1 Tax=Kosakonia sp. SMBL-WEM22 TaxID=2725560 RepID=UPI001658D37B|nr:hypothetical protein [Kosakonia sp. SMBL-WEM22]MDV5356306.1 hypothetical protein [Enterobacter asburiae]QNQ20070.1 hypothetical protein HF650_10020 [Kosakonia sp. SMBL-WEM22]
MKFSHSGDKEAVHAVIGNAAQALLRAGRTLSKGNILAHLIACEHEAVGAAKAIYAQAIALLQPRKHS